MDLNKLAKQKWYDERVDACPVLTEMTGAGFTSELYNAGFPGYKIGLCYYRQRQADWLSLESDQREIGRLIIRKFRRDEGVVLRLYGRWLKNFRLMMRKYYKLFEEDLSQLSDQKLLNWGENLCVFYREKVSMPGFIDGFMFYADKRLNGLLRDFCVARNIENYPRLFAVLTSPIESSFINLEEQGLKKIAKLLKGSGYKTRDNLWSFIQNRKKLLKICKNHLFKYSWIKSSYIGYREYSYDDLGSEIKRLLVERRKGNAKTMTKHKKEKKSLIEKYGFTPEILAISKLTEILVKWQDQRKEYSLTYITLQNKFLREISRRAKIDFDLLRYCQTKEVDLIMCGNFDIHELEKRKSGCLFIYQSGKIKEIITGDQVNRFFSKITGAVDKSLKEFFGMTASVGRATGRARVVMAVADMEKVKRGDILIAPMTRPEHLSAMRRAAAIVTDDGGITCHAAIVARELGIPCIIGTKIATKIFKDGDLVEVDANRGVVRKIK